MHYYQFRHISHLVRSGTSEGDASNDCWEGWYCIECIYENRVTSGAVLFDVSMQANGELGSYDWPDVFGKIHRHACQAHFYRIFVLMKDERGE